ncbi:flavin reductase family protein [Marinobacter sp. chi1]|uniref:Flavin reductase family protein n=1 Tax=Marinobacter suaedae TaxID=3057675 RepID=A0ABT8VY56_9GAMM|nr:flavin reductase family protein [Marinobacter sp. chi1]MDO3720917.1 flavin reductase family protein [Marinobacter sp. chi1]
MKHTEVLVMCHSTINTTNPTDTKQYRSTLGRYPTGVAVVTMQHESGHYTGMTINSFCSLSLSPALVSICIDDRSPNYSSYYHCKGFTLSFLSADQAAIATLFATRGADKFSNIDYSHPENQFAPAITDAIAILDCETYRRMPVGDHLMLVGKVRHFQHSDQAPLVFEQGRFTGITDHQNPAQQTAA